MFNRRFYHTVGICFLTALLTAGCSDNESRLLGTLKERNATSVAKVRTCFQLYESRTRKWPKDKEQLLSFLNSGKVDKNLKRLGISPDSVEDIFVSKRDGKPLKIRWDVKFDTDEMGPVAFESEGVDGVRLVAADTILEVDNDDEYDKLWAGEYNSKIISEED